MRPIRNSRLFFSLMTLLLASLACSLVGTPTEAPAAPTTAPVATSAPKPTQPPEPTKPPEPTQTPEPTATPKPELGALVLDEKFADNSNNWFTEKDKDVEASVADGKYQVRVLAQGNYYWFDGPVSISDADLTTDIEFTEGAPENTGAGFLCHYKDAKNYYRISIAADGYYAIQKWVDDKYSLLAGWNFSNTIKQGLNVTNTIRAICTENHLTLYVNDTLLADVIDNSLTGGSFALVSANFKNKEEDTNPTGVNFSNLVVRKPLAWKLPTGNLLTDSFDDNKNNWDLYDHDKASVKIENGQLVISVTEPDSTYVSYPSLSLSNVDMSFDVTVNEGTTANSGFGAVCRWVDKDNRYMFDISADGQYSLGKRVGGKGTNIVKWTSSNAIKTGTGEVNHIRVVCNGSTLELYINDQMLISTQDTSLIAGGFTVEGGRFKEDDKPVMLGFDNFEVSYPSK